MSSDVRAWIGTVFRLALAVILFWSGAAKLFEGSDAMRRAIIAYRLGLPNGITDVMAWGLPTLELVLGLLLLVGLFTRWAALGTALIMTAFIIGIASVWVRGYNIECGCFGGGGDTSAEGRDLRYTAEILRDLLFTGMAVWLVAWPVTKLSLDRGPRPTYDEIDDDYDTDPDEIDAEEPTA
ncbi:MAG TPA: MauE/DoxX family redox-associated membrane protein [Candidatus Nanopelagicales bacterium]|nr:MauE/DoxX family redox-associated membrane protein [Candidatus Nanopelagicales bacterium]